MASITLQTYVSLYLYLTVAVNVTSPVTNQVMPRPGPIRQVFKKDRWFTLVCSSTGRLLTPTRRLYAVLVSPPVQM